MRAVIQRVENSSVEVEGEIVGSINKGLLVLLAVHKDDNEKIINKMAEKLLKLRVFHDENNKMNLSIQDIKGEFLIVSQFTLYADCKKGNRPGFTDSAKPDKAIPFYEKFVSVIKESGLKTATGKFGAEMKVKLLNDGPVTVIIDL